MMELWERLCRAPMGLGLGLGMSRTGGAAASEPDLSTWTADSETITADSELHTADGSAP